MIEAAEDSLAWEVAMFSASTDPIARRRRDLARSGNRLAAVLRSRWRILLFLVAVLATCLNMNRLMSVTHAEHVAKGIRRQLPEKGIAESILSAAGDDPEALQQRGKGGRSRSGQEKLRGKRQVKLPKTTGSASARADGGGSASSERRFHVQEHAEYAGDVVKWGSEHLQVCLLCRCVAGHRCQCHACHTLKALPAFRVYRCPWHHAP